MRLSEAEQKAIKAAVRNVDPEAQVFLFGSRANDEMKGGDIDILVISENIGYHEKLVIRRELFKNLEDQKIDIVVAQDLQDAFVKSILPEAIAL